ncbi:MAG: EutN/CcmL family microcompartment protein [Planctomycetales bacterium]|nr:EutN/CcmL family microcompartment protein [Planctomycetales bacterium]
MRIARVIGAVTLSKCHPSMVALPFRLVEPVDAIQADGQLVFSVDEPLVAVDLLGSGLGDLVALAEGPEAAQPFRPDIKPVDALSAAILDSLEL